MAAMAKANANAIIPRSAIENTPLGPRIKFVVVIEPAPTKTRKAVPKISAISFWGNVGVLFILLQSAGNGRQPPFEWPTSVSLREVRKLRVTNTRSTPIYSRANASLNTSFQRLHMHWKDVLCSYIQQYPCQSRQAKTIKWPFQTLQPAYQAT